MYNCVYCEHIHTYIIYLYITDVIGILRLLEISKHVVSCISIPITRITSWNTKS